ncbi:hypothetical protein BU15DRAFT_83872 [Melanogaster broomeanus]|nr:hypothetical protein BU15DRAFT_83872 [Melanogaster broomeanus]
MAYAIELDDGTIIEVPDLSIDGRNWKTYRDSVLYIATLENLVQQFDGTDVKPVDATQHEFTAWDQRNRTAKLILITTIPDSLLHVTHLETAYEWFQHLADLFETKKNNVTQREAIVCNPRSPVSTHQEHSEDARKPRERKATMNECENTTVEESRNVRHRERKHDTRDRGRVEKRDRRGKRAARKTSEQEAGAREPGEEAADKTTRSVSLAVTPSSQDDNSRDMGVPCTRVTPREPQSTSPVANDAAADAVNPNATSAGPPEPVGTSHELRDEPHESMGSYPGSRGENEDSRGPGAHCVHVTAQRPQAATGEAAADATNPNATSVGTPEPVGASREPQDEPQGTADKGTANVNATAAPPSVLLEGERDGQVASSTTGVHSDSAEPPSEDVADETVDGISLACPASSPHEEPATSAPPSVPLEGGRDGQAMNAHGQSLNSTHAGQQHGASTHSEAHSTRAEQPSMPATDRPPSMLLEGECDAQKHTNGACTGQRHGAIAHGEGRCAWAERHTGHTTSDNARVPDGIVDDPGERTESGTSGSPLSILLEGEQPSSGHADDGPAARLGVPRVQVEDQQTDRPRNDVPEPCAPPAKRPKRLTERANPPRRRGRLKPRNLRVNRAHAYEQRRTHAKYSRSHAEYGPARPIGYRPTMLGEHPSALQDQTRRIASPVHDDRAPPSPGYANPPRITKSGNRADVALNTTSTGESYGFYTNAIMSIQKALAEARAQEGESAAHEAAFESYLNLLDESDRRIGRGSGHASPVNRRSVSPANQGSTGPSFEGRHASERRDRTPSDSGSAEESKPKRRKSAIDESLFPWGPSTVVLRDSLSPDLQQILLILDNWANDPTYVVRKILLAPGAPDFPPDQWVNIVKGLAVDLNKVLGSHYSTEIDSKQTRDVGDLFQLSLWAPKQTKVVRTHGDWVIAFGKTLRATTFALPQRYEEYSTWQTYISQLFASVQSSHHGRVIEFDKAARLRVANQKHIRLSDFAKFDDLRTIYLSPFGVARVRVANGVGNEESRAMETTLPTYVGNVATNGIGTSVTNLQESANTSMHAISEDAEGRIGARIVPKLEPLNAITTARLTFEPTSLVIPHALCNQKFGIQLPIIEFVIVPNRIRVRMSNDSRLKWIEVIVYCRMCPIRDLERIKDCSDEIMLLAIRVLHLWGVQDTVVDHLSCLRGRAVLDRAHVVHWTVVYGQPRLTNSCL